MTRLRLIALSFLTGTALLLAQDPQNGGWRRWNDPPPAPAPQTQPAVPDVQDQDPTQPVARADSYGQPQQQQQRNDRPPAAVPHYGLPAEVTIRPGTFVTVRVNQELSSDRNQQGDVFSASLAQPIVVDGVVVAQRGQTVMGRVAEAMKAGRAQGTSRLALQLTGITLADGTQANVQSQLVNRNAQTSVGSDVGAVATTTAVGAAIGAAADWGRGAAIGAGAGAAAGLIGVLLTRGHATVVYPETLLTFQVDTPVNVDLTRAPQAFRYVGPDEYDRPVETTVARRPPPSRYYTPYPYYYPGYYPGYYNSYPYAYGPSFGIGIGIRGGGWHHRR
ncbi:MAG: hypothetical protein NTW28_23455 [Candidatus Solibacter sp.]|nr:hypothetical protein [Candidatus Solibacter sp.]